MTTYDSYLPLQNNFLVLTFAMVSVKRYHAVYLGQDVAVKILKSEHLNEGLEEEFSQEVAILR